MAVGIAGVWAAETAATNPPKPEVAAAKVEAPAPAPSVTFKNDQEKASYAIGYKAGSQYRSADIPVDVAMLIQGLKDGISGQRPALANEEAITVLQAFQKDVQEKAEKKQKELAAVNLASSKAFLEANAKKEGVKVLPSGLQYKVLTEGTGKMPTAADKVKVNYKGSLVSGIEFDSSYKRGTPAEFPVTGVIKGWTEALQMMKEGSKWELYIPADLAYGENGRPGIPPNSALIFETELIEIVKPDAAAAAPGPASAPKAGVQVVPAPKASGQAAPAAGQRSK
jgi:FKBP-type peptidyl-prolyl cis-trans isomerase